MVLSSVATAFVNADTDSTLAGAIGPTAQAEKSMNKSSDVTRRTAIRVAIAGAAAAGTGAARAPRQGATDMERVQGIGGSSSAPRIPRNWPAGTRPISASAASLAITIPAVADQRGDNGLRTVQGGHVVLWRPAVAVDDQLPRPRPRQDGRPASRTGHRRRSAL